MNKKIIALILVTLLTVVGCAAFKKVVRTANSVATDLCWIFAADHKDALGGLAPAAWCGIKENLDPFIEYILKAQNDGLVHPTE